MQKLTYLQYQTAAGITVQRSGSQQDYHTAVDHLVDQLDSQQGILLASSFEYPGRYTRWDMGFCNPPLEISSHGSALTVEALNRRGQVLLPEIYEALRGDPDIRLDSYDSHRIRLCIQSDDGPATEELRSRRPSVFSVLRKLVALFYSAQDSYLGLYGAFGYDLGFQFEDVVRHHERDPKSREMVLYLPDEILVADHRTETALTLRYEFVCRSRESAVRSETTGGFRRTGRTEAFVPARQPDRPGDHANF